MHEAPRRRTKVKHVDAHAPVMARPDCPALMGAAEVAAALRIRVQNLQFLKGLPEPVAKLRATRVWLADEVIAFGNTRRGYRAD